MVLVELTTPCIGTDCWPTASHVDFVGYGTANAYETMPAPAPSVTTAVIRLSNGCYDTDNNLTDFVVGPPAPRNSSATAVVCPTVPVNTTTPSISGRPQVGQTLSCDPGTWSGAEPLYYSYQWLREGADIPDASGPTYQVSVTDAGMAVGCRVTVTNSYGEQIAYSNHVTVPVPPANTTNPIVVGTVKIGQVATCSPGDWTGDPAITYAYQWLLDGDAIAIATDQAYTPIAGDAGHQLSCRVTATNPGGSASATSAEVRVPVPPANTTLPAVGGSLTPGGTLACAQGTWSGDEPLVFAYQWLDEHAPIAGAGAQSFDRTVAGHVYSCRVTATNPGGVQSAESDGARIGVPPGNVTIPRIGGVPESGQTLSCAPGSWTGDAPIEFSHGWIR